MGLCPVVLAPDMEHEDTGNEQKGHHKHRHWPNLNSRAVISVEPPHSSTAGAPRPHGSPALVGAFPALCLTPPPPALGELPPPPLGLPAPTLVALAAGPGILCLSLYSLVEVNQAIK